ncbi:MAG: two-component system, chemotaxis family, sensor kinase CheA [Clostridia bacterium]|nr:two-component system, chemotaxis family, sensor kinase CheA [Clostridia bacterium]
MSDFDVSQYLGIFLDEAEEQLQQLDEAIILLEQNRQDGELLNKIFRVAHTLKGSSASMGFEKMATLTHRMESVLDALRQRRLTVSREIIDLLLACLDTLQALKNEVAGGGEGQVEIAPLVARLEAILDEGRLPQETGAAAPREKLELNDIEQNVIRAAEVKGYRAYQIDVTLEKDCQMKGARAFLVFNNLKDLGEVIKSVPHTQELEAEKFEDSFQLIFVSREDADTLANVIKSISEIKEVVVRPVILDEDAGGQEAPCAAAAPLASPAAVKTAKKDEIEQRRLGQTVRVDVQRLERLMNLVGELVIDRTRLAEVGNGLKSRLGDDDLVETLEEVSMHIGRITSDLQEEIMKARMFPIDQVFNRFPRMVRDLAQRAGKEIDFIIEGRETELDRTVIEEIGDPLIHLLRNAIDHGIEPPERRLQAGKPRQGRVILKAFHQENQIVIIVEDDGVGMDVEVIRRKAVERGLVAQEVASRLSPREVLNFIFLPGFSTSDRVTDVSGRGVGMDIVRAHLEKINGTIDIQTAPGKGTRFTIRLPLTLAISRSLLVYLAGRIYAFPLANVMEILTVERKDVQFVRGQEVTLVRGRVLPLFHLDAILNLKQRVNREGRYQVVVVGLAEKQVGFIVDDLLGEQEIVIKSLGDFIGKIPGLAGATIMGDGRVALILDVRSLVDQLGVEAGRELAS